MKKILLLNSIIIAFLIPGFSQTRAQEAGSVQLHTKSEGTKIYHLPAKKHLPGKALKSQLSRTTTCGTDTLIYPYLKELVFSAPNDSFFVDAMVGNVRTASQAYVLSTSVNVVGVQFWGYAYSVASLPKSMQVKAYLYAVDAFYKPTTALDSAIITTTNVENYYQGVFTAPHTMNTNFAVGVKCIPNDTLAVITNNAGTAWHNPDYSESLAWRRFGSGTWNSTLSFFGQDLEYMIFPIVSYSVSSAFTASSSAICAGDSVTFTNTSPSIPLVTNRMFNLYAFDAFWGFAAADSSIKWNYGSSSAWNTSVNGSNTFSTPGTYNVRLASEIITAYNSCTDTASLPIQVNAVYNTTASANICHGESYVFGTQTLTAPGTYTETFSSVGTCDSTVVLTLTVDTLDLSVTVGTGSLTANAMGVAYQWIDCNNANAAIPGATYQVFHPAADGNYAVVIKKVDCQDTSVCILYIGTGVTTYGTALHVTAFPNPITNQLTIQCEGMVPEQITIKNILGETVMETRPSNASTIVDTDNFASSVYFVHVTYKGYSKIIKVTKK
jgi:hypothetical protein